jgi:hypothetical protein
MRNHFILTAIAASFLTVPVSAQQSALQQLGAGAMPEVPTVAAPMPLPGGTLTVYSYPPYRPLSWKTPKAALATLFPNMVAESLPGGHQVNFYDDNGDQDSMSSNNRSSVGHVITHVACTLPDGEAYDAWTGFSGDEDPAVDKDNLLRKKLGLGVLFNEYADGHVINGTENQLELIYYKGRKGIAPRYWQQNIDGAACGRVRDMVEFYRGFGEPEGRSESNQLYYTFNIDPYQSYLARKGGSKGRVGADCATYGIGLLKAAGKYDAALDPALAIKVDVSERLIGGVRGADGQVRTVSVWEILGALGSHWTYPGYANRTVSTFDPYLVWKFIGEAGACLRGAPGCSNAASAWLASKGGAVTAGPVQQMSDTQDVKASTDTKGRQLTTTMKIEGIVVE